jgi:tetratricopeptide (TPR) repeat protein
MNRRKLVVILLLSALPIALACGPYFNDARHGLLKDQLQSSLETVYARLLRPEATRDALAKNSRAFCETAKAAESEEKWDDARAAWNEAIRTVGFDGDAVHSWRIREIRDHLDLLPLIGRKISNQEWNLYLAAAEIHLDPWQTRPREVQREPLLALGSSANNELASAALTTLAWRELQIGNVANATSILATARARAPDGPKVDEVSFLEVVAPVFAHLSKDGHVDDPEMALGKIQKWIDGHPTSPWRFHALGWEAFILYQHREIAWGQDLDGLLAATRIWQNLLADPDGSEMFTSATESLRFSYRKLRPQPPEWVVADPRHAAAFAWHAVTDQVSPIEREKILAATEPALQHLSDTEADPELLHLLALTWVAAGRTTSALPLAQKALEKRDTPEIRYLAARLSAENGNPADAERISEPLTTPGDAFDLLVRIGSAWEDKREWAKALSAYVRANSDTDVAVLTDGEMPIDVLMERVNCGESFRSTIDNPWSYYEDSPAMKSGHDYLPELRGRLASRLVRAGRATEALPFFEGESRGLCAGLIALENDLRTGAENNRGRHLYALASFWYDQGKKLVYVDRHWHQWAAYRFFGRDVKPSPQLDADRARVAADMEAMSVYYRAYPMFLEIADRYPADPHAPDALYKAALCLYWHCGQTYMKFSWWWEDRAKREHNWDRGDALLRRLAATYPNHALAHDPKVVRAVAGLKP